MGNRSSNLAENSENTGNNLEQASQTTSKAGHDTRDLSAETIEASSAQDESQTQNSGGENDDEALTSSGYPDNFMDLSSSDEEENEEEREATGDAHDAGVAENSDVKAESHDTESSSNKQEALGDNGVASADNTTAATSQRPTVLPSPFELLERADKPKQGPIPRGTKGLRKAKYQHGNEQHRYVTLKRRYHVRQRSSLSDITTVIYDDEGSVAEERNESQGPIGPRLPVLLELPDIVTPVVPRPKRDEPYANNASPAPSRPTSPGPSRPTSPITENRVPSLDAGGGLAGLGINVGSSTTHSRDETILRQAVEEKYDSGIWEEAEEELNMQWAARDASARSPEITIPDVDTSSQEAEGEDGTTEQATNLSEASGRFIARTPTLEDGHPGDSWQSEVPSEHADTTVDIDRPSQKVEGEDENTEETTHAEESDPLIARTPTPDGNHGDDSSQSEIPSERAESTAAANNQAIFANNQAMIANNQAIFANNEAIVVDVDNSSQEVEPEDITTEETTFLPEESGPLIVRTPALNDNYSNDNSQSEIPSERADPTVEANDQASIANNQALFANNQANMANNQAIVANKNEAAAEAIPPTPVLPTTSDVAALERRFSIDNVSHREWKYGNAFESMTEEEARKKEEEIKRELGRQALTRGRDAFIETHFAEHGEYPYPGISREKYAELIWTREQMFRDNSIIHQQLRDLHIRYREYKQSSIEITDEFRETIEKLKSEKDQTEAEIANTNAKLRSVSEQYRDCRAKGKELSEKIAALTKELDLRSKELDLRTKERDRYFHALCESRKSAGTGNPRWPNPERLAGVAAEYLNSLAENKVQVEPQELAQILQENPTFDEFCRYLLDHNLRFKSERLAQAIQNSDVFVEDPSSEAAQDLDRAAWSVLPFESVTMANMRRALNDLQEDARRLRQYIDALEADGTQLHLQIDEYQTAIEDYQNQIKKYQKGTVPQVTESGAEQEAPASEDPENCRAEVQSLKKKNAELETASQESKAVLGTVLEAQEKSDQTIEELKTKLSEAKAKSDGQMKDIEQLRADLAASQGTPKQLTEQSDHSGTETFQKSPDDLTVKLEKCEKQNKTMQGYVNTMKERNDKLEQELRQRRQTETNLRNSNAELRNKLSNCEAGHQTMFPQIVDLKKSHKEELQMIRSSSEAKIQSLTKALQDLQRSNPDMTTLQEQLAKCQADGTRMEQNIVALSRADEAHKVSPSESSSDTKEDGSPESRQSEDALRAKCSDLESTVAILRESVENGATYANANEKLKSELTACKTRAAELQKQINVLQKDTREQNRKPSPDSGVRDLLEGEIETSTSRIRRLEDANRDISRKLDLTKAELVKAQETTNRIRAQRDQALKKWRSLNNERAAHPPIFSTFEDGRDKGTRTDMFDTVDWQKERAAYNAWWDGETKAMHKRWFDLCGYVPEKQPAVLPPASWSY